MYNLTVFNTETNEKLYINEHIDIGEVVCNIMDVFTESTLKYFDDREFELAIQELIRSTRPAPLENGFCRMYFNEPSYNVYKVYGVDAVTYHIEEV